MSFLSNDADKMMTRQPKILVVGTTEDYVEWIRAASPGQAIFLVDGDGRKKRWADYPSSDDEIITDLSDFDSVFKAIKDYFDTRKFSLEGIVCFDCEYMALTARLSDRFQLSYPPLSAILNCRDKFLSKKIWQSAGVPCPRAGQVSTLEAALLFFSEEKGPCVIKPLTGSGSELVFVLKNEEEVAVAFEKVKTGLEKRTDSAMYGNTNSPVMVMESYLEGEEHSCDFMIEKDQVHIIRLTRKIYYPDGPFGTTWTYVFLPVSDLDTDAASLGEVLRKAAAALGIDRAICMADIIVQKGVPHLLEMTPRPGGDCLPHLLKAFWRIDMLNLALDFSTKKPLPKKPSLGDIEENLFAGVRIFAEKEGLLKKVHTEKLLKDSRVRDVYLKFPEGHSIKLPPEDYDSWILGHVAIQFHLDRDLLTQLFEIKNQIHLEMAS